MEIVYKFRKDESINIIRYEEVICDSIRCLRFGGCYPCASASEVWYQRWLECFDASNKTGFFIGPMVKVSLPLGFSVDAAALYDQKSADVKYEYTEAMYVDKTTDGSLQSPSGDVVCQKSSGVAKVKQQSINVPVNLRYAVGLGSMANMFFFAGPQWGFNIGHKNYGTESYGGNENRNFLSFKDSNFSINVGLGATLLKHLQVSANYNIACGKTADITYGKALQYLAKARSRSNCWQIALGYWF